MTINGTPEQTHIAQYLVNLAMSGADVKTWGANDVTFALAQQGQGGGMPGGAYGYGQQGHYGGSQGMMNPGAPGYQQYYGGLG